MNIVVCFYTNKKFESISENLINHYKSKGFNDIRHFKSEDIKNGDFYIKNKEILECETGDGFWLWKPKIILDILNEINFGDSVLYTDAGDLLDINYEELNNFLNVNDYYFTNWGGSRWPQKICTKRDCFVLMDCDEEKYHQTSQMEAGTLIIKKTKETLELVKDYLYYCSIKQIIDNEPNKFSDNFDGWQFHRNDQSVLTNLIVKHDLKFNNFFDNKIKNNVFTP